MCYVVARAVLGHGSIAVPLRRGQEVVQLKHRIRERYGDAIELLTISNPDAYGEYAPYTIAEDAEEFERMVYERYVK